MGLDTNQDARNSTLPTTGSQSTFQLREYVKKLEGEARTNQEKIRAQEEKLQSLELKNDLDGDDIDRIELRTSMKELETKLNQAISEKELLRAANIKYESILAQNKVRTYPKAMPCPENRSVSLLRLPAFKRNKFLQQLSKENESLREKVEELEKNVSNQEMSFKEETKGLHDANSEHEKEISYLKEGLKKEKALSAGLRERACMLDE